MKKDRNFHQMGRTQPALRPMTLFFFSRPRD